jgi:alanyl-tRNA synthetase
MNSSKVRQLFLEYFQSKGHHVVESAPMVVKNDPTLMFTNAGMNQFKDIFLGNSPVKYPRIANTQKCLRVSGKHNDLEEVGHDTYHHTMFEMLGNWSFGDYFKKEAIEWAWDLLTNVYGIEKDRLYASVFGGDSAEGLELDQEAYDIWEKIVGKDRIILGSKKDNFWEMGDTGPCGPCSEVHVDLRDDSERQQIPGSQLVNNDHPLVVEIWNLVFIQYNRLSSGQLVSLPAKHVDTGMGFERLCMALQGKKSNYDTDVFQPYIAEIAKISGVEYGKSGSSDVAMRVIADHLRAVAFAIADGELPSNNKAGYVIRRILRRAIRYGYTFLGFRQPFVCELVPVMVKTMGDAFPELAAQQELISRVIAEEESTFFRTLATGITKFEHYVEINPTNKVVDGQFAFELFDTYGFPVDLTALMAREKGLEVDMVGFDKGMQEQKTRSRAATTLTTGDWVILSETDEETVFVGYDNSQTDVVPLKYREVESKGKKFFQLVLDKTPFYAESGGQVGDKGVLVSDGVTIKVLDTLKENNLIVHIVDNIPNPFPKGLTAKVDLKKRRLTENNHSATHLMHAALKEVLGQHVQQKGSMVDGQRLRFDFSHFAKMTPEEIKAVEKRVNAKIRENVSRSEHRDLEMADAKKMGAVALFGEKYGDKVRVIAFDETFSTELCGGTHVASTGQIGLFKIVSEGAIAAGVRRIEAITGELAEDYVDSQIEELNQVRAILKNPKSAPKALEQVLEQSEALRKKMEALQKEQATNLVSDLSKSVENIGGVNFIGMVQEMDGKMAKDLAFAAKSQIDNLFLVIAHSHDGKPGLVVALSENVVTDRKFDASVIVRKLAQNINGGGGGQPHFATAGGKNVNGLEKAIAEARAMLTV